MALNQVGLGILLSVATAGLGSFAKVRNGFEQTHDAAGRFGERSKTSFNELKTGLAVMTAGLVGLGAALSTVPAAAEFGGKIAEIGTLTEEASLNTDFLAQSVLGLNAAFGGGTAAQAKALYDGISAGASSAEEATALLTASNRLAVAGVTQVNVALDGLTSSLNAYGISFKEAGAFSDAMFTAVRKGKTTIAELGASIGHVAPTASALGVSFDELNAALAAVTLKGIKTDMAATGLSAALANVIKPSSDAAAEAGRLGIKFDAATLRAKGFRGFLDQITGSAKFNQDSMGKLFGSVEALRTVLALTADDSKNFHGALDAMAKKTGAADRAFEAMSKTTAFQGKRFTALAENAKILVGQALEPLAAAVLNVVNNVLEGFGRIPKPIRDFAVQAFAAASAVVAVVGAVLAAKAAFAIGAAALKAFGVAAGGGLLASLGPVVLVLGAVALAVLAFRQAVQSNLGGIGDTFTRLYEGVKLAFDALGQLFSQGGFSGKVREEFLKGENVFVNFAVRAFLIVERVRNFFSGLADGFGAAVAKINFGKLVNALQEIGGAFGLLFNDTTKSGKSFDAFGSAGARVGDVLGKVAGVVVAVFTAAANIVAGFAKVWGMVSDGIDEAVDALGEAFSAIGEVVSALLGASTEGLTAKTVFQLVGAAVGGVLGTALKLAAAAVRILANLLKDVASVLGGVVDVIAGIVTGDWTRVWLGLKKVVFGVVSAVVSVILGLVEAVAAVVDALASLAGKDLGFAKSVSGFRDSVRESMKDTLGLESTVTVKPAAPPIPNTGASATASPAVAGVQPNASFDPALVSSAAASAASAAVSKAPSPPINVTLQVDSEVLARATVRGRESSAAASYEPQAVSSE